MTQFFARVKKQYLHGMKETRISGILTSFWTINVSVRFAFVVTDSLPPPVPAPRQTSFVQGLHSIRFHFIQENVGSLSVLGPDRSNIDMHFLFYS